MHLLTGQDETQQLSIVIKQQEAPLGTANLGEFWVKPPNQNLFNKGIQPLWHWLVLVDYSNI